MRARPPSRRTLPDRVAARLAKADDTQHEAEPTNRATKHREHLLRDTPLRVVPASGCREEPPVMHDILRRAGGATSFVIEPSGSSRSRRSAPPPTRPAPAHVVLRIHARPSSPLPRPLCLLALRLPFDLHIMRTAHPSVCLCRAAIARQRVCCAPELRLLRTAAFVRSIGLLRSLSRSRRTAPPTAARRISSSPRCTGARPSAAAASGPTAPRPIASEELWEASSWLWSECVSTVSDKQARRS